MHGLARRLASERKVLLQGRAGEIDGGMYERIQIDSGATNNRIRNLVFNNWATGSGGFFDNGTSTFWSGLYDQDLASFVYPLKDRSGITVTASPFSYTNTTGAYEEVRITGGTVTQVLQYRGTDFWIAPTLDGLQRLLAPGDRLVVSYSVAPSMNHIPHNGFQG